MSHSLQQSSVISTNEHTIQSRMDGETMTIEEYIPYYLHVTGRPTEWGSLSGVIRYTDLLNYIESARQVSILEELEQILAQEIGNLDEKSQQRIKGADLHKKLLQKLSDQKEKLRKGQASKNLQTTINQRGLRLLESHS